MLAQEEAGGTSGSTAELDAEALGRVRLPLEEASTLPPDAYTSPGLYEKERQDIFERSWLAVARTDQIGEPGDYLTLTLLGRPLLIVRGQDGAVRVLANVCRHRAAVIAEGAGSRKLFSCPYHAWSYDTTGQLVRAPLMEGADGFDPSACRLQSYRTEIWNGFIFVTFDDSAPPLADQIRTYTETLKPWALDDLVLVETLSYDTKLNWKVLVENFMEAYHHIATHSTTFEPRYHAKDSYSPDTDGPWSILVMPSEMPHETLPGLTSAEDLTDDQSRMLLATVIFPFFMLGIQGDLVAWYQVLPDRHDRFELKIHICVHKASLESAEIEEARDILKFGVDAIHQEDIVANDLVWAGLNAPETQQGRLSPLEKPIWQLNQWWLERMGLG